MDKRDFIKTGLFGVIGLFSMPLVTKSNSRIFKSFKTFKLPLLPFSYNALEPFIDEETMKLHHLGHHKTYTDNLNAAIHSQSIQPRNIRDIFQNAPQYDKAILENGSGFLNHRIFWKMLSPNGGGQANGKIGKAIESEFGSFENFKEEFSSAANSISEPGWVWLINKNNSLKVITTTDHENPFLSTLPNSKKGFPILCLDICEHAYYLKYQNKKNDYINAFWKVINWENINLRYSKSIS